MKQLFNEKEYQEQYRLKHRESKRRYNQQYYIDKHEECLENKREYHTRTYIPHPRGIVRIPLEERFWKLVNKRGASDCWNWRGVPNMWGYGQIREEGGRSAKKKLAHRVSWNIHNGKIPDGLLVLHKCDNPACVNPNHLWLGTFKDNSDDMIRKGRHTKGGWGRK